MADTQETITDIIAEMRGMGNYQRYSGDHARVLANRLDAAHKRERGDAAKLREALETLRELLGDLLRLGDAEYHDDFSNFCDIIDAALSAPPRNCDVMDWRTAWKMWREKFHPETPVGYSAVVKGTKAFMDWFTAPAMAKEGGTK